MKLTDLIVKGLGALVKGPAGAVVEVVGSAWKDHRALKQAKLQGEIQYLATEQGHRHAWEVASINQSGKGLRWASFVMWSGPMIYGWFDPHGAAEKMSALLAAFPEWYVYGWFLMLAGIWGVKEWATVKRLGEERTKKDLNNGQSI